MATPSGHIVGRCLHLRYANLACFFLKIVLTAPLSQISVQGHNKNKNNNRLRAIDKDKNSNTYFFPKLNYSENHRPSDPEISAYQDQAKKQ